MNENESLASVVKRVTFADESPTEVVDRPAVSAAEEAPISLPDDEVKPDEAIRVTYAELVVSHGALVFVLLMALAVNFISIGSPF